MSLSVLTNIAALESGSSLLLTQARLQSTLLQLSSGSRINSGADDAAGLAIVAGLGANRAALTQSAGNAESGIGLLRVADGALSQVTTLLDRAVTLATEAANGTLNSAQVSSAGAEYQAILQEIGDISATTTVNGQAVFSNSPSSIYVGDGTSYGATGDSFEVGALSLSSIGENPQTQVVSGPVVPVLGLPAAAINSVAGVYSLAASAAGDTFSGTLSIQIGGNGPVTQLTVAAGTTQSQVEALVNGNGTLASEGVLATLDGSGNLQITGPPSGTALNFAGTSLADAQTSTPFVPTATPATPATQAVSFLYEDNSLGGNDPITAGGTLTATFNGSTYQYTAPAGTVLNDILPALQTLFTGSGISVALSAAPSGNPGRYDFFFVFTGTPGVAGPISLTSSLVDVDNGGPFAAVAAAVGAPAAPPYTTYTFGNETSVFSGNLAITAGAHAAVTVATAGLTGSRRQRRSTPIRRSRGTG